MPGEARCTDLGANCLCSAPFNNNDFPDFTTEDIHNFSDDYDANGGECSALTGFEWTVKTVPAFDTPAGFTGRVLSYYDAGGAMSHEPFDWGDEICGQVPNAKRVCVRIYKRYSANASHATNTGGSPPDNEIKFLESGSFQGNSGPGVDTIHFRMVDNTCDEGVDASVGVADMKTEWVRWEVCFSAPSGDLCNSSGAIDLYVQTKLVDTGTVDTVSITGCTDDNALGGRYIDKIHINGWDNTNTASDELTYISHYMVAAWNTTSGASGPWIGAAEEIEGEGGAAPAASNLRNSVLMR